MIAAELYLFMLCVDIILNFTTSFSLITLEKPEGGWDSILTYLDVLHCLRDGDPLDAGLPPQLLHHHPLLLDARHCTWGRLDFSGKETYNKT